jgi:hypothetical protein
MTKASASKLKAKRRASQKAKARTIDRHASKTIEYVLGAAPAVVIPQVPSGFVLPVMSLYMGYRPTQIEVAHASGAAVDLRAWSDLAPPVSSAAPSAKVVADALSRAMEWRAMRGAVQALQAYVTAGDAHAWKTALLLVEELKPLFAYAVKKSAVLAETYPSLTALMGAGQGGAQRANATKRSKAKQKAEAAQAAALAEAVAEALKAKTDAATKAAQAKAKAEGAGRSRVIVNG